MPMMRHVSGGPSFIVAQYVSFMRYIDGLELSVPAKHVLVEQLVSVGLCVIASQYVIFVSLHWEVAGAFVVFSDEGHAKWQGMDYALFGWEKQCTLDLNTFPTSTTDAEYVRASSKLQGVASCTAPRRPWQGHNVPTAGTLAAQLSQATTFTAAQFVGTLCAMLAELRF